MINILALSFIFIFVFIFFKFESSYYIGYSSVFVKITDVVVTIIKLVLMLLAITIWILLMNEMFDAGSLKIVDEILNNSIKNNDSVFLFIWTSFTLISVITAIVIYKTCKYIYELIRLLIRLKTQKKPTIENAFLKTLNNGSDTEIVKIYKMRTSAPYFDKVQLDECNKMKLITALINESEYEHAEQLGKFYVGRNSKLIKKNTVLKPIKRAIQRKGENNGKFEK